MNTREYVLKHIRSVRAKLYVILNEISKRVLQHDKSKLEYPEYNLWCKMDEEPRYKYGTKEYFDKIERNKHVFNLHYKHNTHHPEHYVNGILDMDLVDVLEMLIDWISYKDKIRISEAIELIEQQSRRYGLSEEFECVLKNTLINYFCKLTDDQHFVISNYSDEDLHAIDIIG